MSNDATTELVDQIAEVCREELEALWSDLSQARRRAVNGVWSIECENLQYRIEQLTKVAGPTEWEAVQIDLIEDGIYQRIHSGLGIEVHPDMARVAEVREATAARVAATRRMAGRDTP